MIVPALRAIVVAGFMCLGTVGCAWGQPAVSAVLPPIKRSASHVSQAGHAMILGLTSAGSRIVAVGERGIILLSDDNGNSWRQAKSVPVSVSLTAVRFLDEHIGWVTGHSGIVLRSDDGGEHWRKQLDGENIIELLKATAKLNQEARIQAEQFELDGPDKPLLDLFITKTDNVFVVGAYGLALKSINGGKTWTPWLDHFNNPKGLHFNAISGQGETIVVVGERGAAFMSIDGGERFSGLDIPYSGSLFSVAVTRNQKIIIGGLRGNAYFSEREGKDFKKIELPDQTSLNALIEQVDGNIVFGSESGSIFKLTELGGRIVAKVLHATSVGYLTSILTTSDGSLVAGGAVGIMRLGIDTK